MSTSAVAHRTDAASPLARLLDGTSIRKRRIEAAGISTALLEAGTGSDLVILHGPAEFAAGWSEVIEALAGTHHVVAPDLPGHGASAANGDLGVELIVAWLDDVVSASCAAPPAVVGRVLGGAIAMRYALANEDRISQLVLVDTLGLKPFEPAPPFGEALQRFLAEPTSQTHERLMQYCVHDFDGTRTRLGGRWSAYGEYAVDRLRQPARLATIGSLMATFGMPEISETALAGIVVPTDLIWGRHDMATPLSAAESASRAFGWPLHVVEDAADDPALEQPEAFLGVLRAVLGKEHQ